MTRRKLSRLRGPEFSARKFLTRLNVVLELWIELHSWNKISDLWQDSIRYGVDVVHPRIVATVKVSANLSNVLAAQHDDFNALLVTAPDHKVPCDVHAVTEWIRSFAHRQTPFGRVALNLP